MTIYCPKCESEARDDDSACPNCGHALSSTEEAAHTLEAICLQDASHDFLGEIGSLRMLGMAAIAAGALLVALGMMWGVAWFLPGLGMIYVGYLTRCAGGIWATLERIARK